MTTDEMSLPATKGDVIRIHDKLDEITDKLSGTAKKSDIPARPCQSLETHLAEHKQTRTTWQAAMIQGVVGVAKAAIFATAGYLAALFT